MNQALGTALRPSCGRLSLYVGAIGPSRLSGEHFFASTGRSSLWPAGRTAWTPSSSCWREQARVFTCSVAGWKAKDPRKARKAISAPEKSRSKPPVVRRRHLLDWRDYNDSTGMPLPTGDQSPAQIALIFGPTVGRETGNRLLRVLQYRRVSGSLAEHGIAFNDPQLAALVGSLAIKGLEYLREKHPVDEAAAAAAWAEEEAIVAEQELVNRAQSLRLLKKDDDAAPIRKSVLQGTEYGQRYGVSVLETVRRENERRHEASLKREAEQRQQASPSASDTRSITPKSTPDNLSKTDGTEQSGGSFRLPSLAKAREFSRKQEIEKPKWWRKYNEIELERLPLDPNTPVFNRLMPSYIFALVVLILLYAWNQSYEMPVKAKRWFPDIPPSVATCMGIFFINLAVFLAWRFPPFYRFMNTYFYMVPGMPVAVSTLTNIFSHQTLKHLATNMITLFLVGPHVHEWLGRGEFVMLYVAAGVTGSLSSLTWFTLRHNFTTLSLGASGSVNGLLAAFILLINPLAFDWFPFRGEFVTVPLLDVQIPASALLFWPLLLVLEFWGMSRGIPVRTDFMSHIGGYCMGTVAASYYLVRQRRAQSKASS